MSDLGQLFEESLDTIERIVAWVAVRNRLVADELEDFRQEVHVRLMEDDYRVLAQFTGRSTLKTFLTTVVLNLARDYRMARWGRWRPSAAAEREGLAAVQLEVLVWRDGFSFEEAVEKMRSDLGVRMSRSEIADLAGRLPQRERLRVEVDGETVDRAAGEDRADSGLLECDRYAALGRAERELGRCLAELEPEERLILKMHYSSGLTISAISRALGLDPRQTYTRHRSSLMRVRRCADKAGVDAGTVLEALSRPEARFEVDFGLEEAVPAKKGSSNSLNGLDEGNQ